MRGYRRLAALVCCVTILIAGVGGLISRAEDTPRAGTVKADLLYIRTDAGTSFPSVGSIPKGGTVTVLGEKNDKAGDKWYHLTYNGITGYSSAAYIELTPEIPAYVPDEEFEAHLTAQGFPESYKPGLRALRARHPQWIFVADKLPLTWAAALDGESRIGLNTVQSPDGWKSMEYGAYDWTKNAYVAFDSGGWVAASRAAVAYCLDPRNSLDPSYAMQFEELTFSANQTADGVRAILPNKLSGITDTLYSAAKAYNVSAYFLAAKITQEGTVSNGLALGTVSGYKGYYNFFDIGAYAHSGRGAVENGAIYAKNHGWNTPEACIVGSVRDYFAKTYISVGQDTIYYQKFNVSPRSGSLYGHQYMTNVQGARSEALITYRNAPDSYLASALILRIPVYEDMPGTAAAYPPQTGDNNNFLTGITLSGGYALTPTFDRYTMSYAAQVPSAVTEITVSAQCAGSGAKISGGGTVRLASGENAVPLTVTASSGEQRIYRVIITREPGGDPLPDDKTPTITGKTYTVKNGVITGVEPETAVDAFIKALAVTDGTAQLYTASGEPKTGGKIGTGDIVRLYSDRILTASYPVIIYGDVNGDGSVSSFDLRIAQKHILKLQTLSGYMLTAADSNKDGNVTSFDLRTTQKFVLKLIKTLQQ